MATHLFSVQVAAPRGLVFDLWTNLHRLPEWVTGVSKVTEITGPAGRAGTRYTLWFGPIRCPQEILEAVPGRMVRTRFRSPLLRGEMLVTFETQASVTRVTQEFRTNGFLPAIAARLLATGSYRGSFRGELRVFARLVQRSASASDARERAVDSVGL
jgi:uncharacterized protein YndB with AHSA1/START domain